jgi:RNA polymerase sigma-70 factor, ECF subfamily
LQNIDRNLVERFREGDADAFEELYERMHQRIYRFGLRWIGNREDAEDVTVQTFAEAHRSRARFLGQSSLETWLYRIAIHQVHRISRKRRQHVHLDEAHIDESAQIPLQCIELEQLLNKLSERQRGAFLLVKSEGLSYREAAEVLGRPMGTVQSDVHEASKKLRSIFFSEPLMKEQVENYGYEL